MKAVRAIVVLVFCGSLTSRGFAEDGKEPTVLKSGQVWALSFSPDGRTLASGGPDGYDSDKESYHALLWDVKTGKPAQLSGHESWIWDVVFSPDGKTLATSSSDRTLNTTTIRLWNTETRRVTATFSHYLAHPLLFSPDSQTLASVGRVKEGDEEQDVKLWNLKTGKITATMKVGADYIRSLAFSPDGTALAVGTDKGKILLCDVKTGKLTATLEGHTGRVSALAFSRNGKELHSACSDKALRRWTVATGKAEVLKLDHPADGCSLAFSPDLKVLAMGDEKGGVTLWDTATGKKIATLGEHPDLITAITFSPDGKTLASGSSDGNPSLVFRSGVLKLWPVKLPAPKR